MKTGMGIENSMSVSSLMKLVKSGVDQKNVSSVWVLSGVWFIASLKCRRS